jgi:small subunit ribosomal protein S8
MITTDPIADYLTRIRNAQKSGHEVVSIPASKIKIAITHILKREGFVHAYKCFRDNKQGTLKIALKYNDNTGVGVISNLKRQSSPGCRRYVRSDNLPRVRRGYGLAILSTSRGVITCKEASAAKIGGEYLCSVY